jgi:hypothetical protein
VLVLVLVVCAPICRWGYAMLDVKDRGIGDSLDRLNGLLDRIRDRVRTQNGARPTLLYINNSLWRFRAAMTDTIIRNFNGTVRNEYVRTTNPPMPTRALTHTHALIHAHMP